MELRPTKNRQIYLISFQYILYYNKLYKRSISKQRYSQLAGSVTENVAKLSFASERMQAAERAHNFVVDFCLQTTLTVARCCDVDHRFDLCRPDSYTDVDADGMSNSRRSPSLIPVSVASTTLADESPTDLFVASH